MFDKLKADSKMFIIIVIESGCIDISIKNGNIDDNDKNNQNDDIT
jgi:hypothetical protein